MNPVTETLARRTRVTLGFLLLTGGLLRLALVFLFEGQPPEIVDAKDYNGLAIRLVETGSYQDASGQLTSLRPPLYPFLVSVLYRGFGLENWTAVRVAQVLVSLLTLLLVYQLGKDLYSVRVGLWAAAGYCFYPTLLGMNNLLLSETLFTFFFIAAMLLAVQSVSQPSLSKALGMGVCLALGALTRSILWLFSPLFCGLLLLAIQAPWRKRILTAGMALATFLLVIFPWAWRNTQLHRTLVIIDVMGGRNVMMGNYEYTPLERSWATISDVTGEKAWHTVLAQHTPGYSQLTQGQIDKAAMKSGIRFFFSHLGLSIQRSIVKFFNFWQLERTFAAGMAQGLFGEIPKLTFFAVSLVICGSYALVLFLAIFGAGLAPPTNRWSHIVLLFGIAFSCLIHSVAFAHSRYHLPLIPILLVYAAAAVVQWKVIWAKRTSWAFAVASISCVVLVASWIRELVAVDLHHFG